MKYRKYDSKTKLTIILEHLERQVPVAMLCNKYQISNTLFYYWLREFMSRAHRVFDTEKQSLKEQRLRDENMKLKHIIADLTIELKKTGKLRKLRDVFKTHPRCVPKFMLRPVPTDGDRSGIENGAGLDLNFENVPYDITIWWKIGVASYKT